jgi:cobalt-zinc-cadmium efflux system outer membrane protein
MSQRRLLVLSGLLLLSGCLYHAREQADETVCALASHPYDLLPPQPAEAKTGPPASSPTPAKQAATSPVMDVQTAAYMQAEGKPKLEPKIPPEIPGSEAKPIRLPPVKEKEKRERAIEQLYPPLPPLPAEPTALPGPDGRPYTLADLQQLAAANSPELRQAAYDVEMARGNLIQARAYPNPTVGWSVQPSNDGSTAGVQGPFVDQTIKFAGKIKLASAAAEMDLRNAELALRRARSDLATRVRNAYYAHLVAKETVRVNKALARFTDEIYRLHTGLLGAGAVASYEPMALRALAYTAALAYRQAIQTYIYSWNQLVATVGLRHLPLTEVAGRIDAVIPYFDYDAVRARVLSNHTDVLTARNGLDKARYNLKLAQITPFPDVDINVAFLKEFALAPKQFVHTATIGFPLPIWDHNKGAIIAAESALGRATEEPHRVEWSLTNTLATAYMGYKTNLEALEYYRRYILPDQVRAYRGVLDRRQIDPGAAFADLLGAQQTLAADVTAYLGILGSLWTSAVGVADLLQTDDLFQLGEPRALPALPDLDQLLPWPCCHQCPPSGAEPKAECSCCPTAPTPGGGPSTLPGADQALPAPRRVDAPAQGSSNRVMPQSLPTLGAQQPAEAAPSLASESQPLPPATRKKSAGETVPQAVPTPLIQPPSARPASGPNGVPSTE